MSQRDANATSRSTRSSKGAKGANEHHEASHEPNNPQPAQATAGTPANQSTAATTAQTSQTSQTSAQPARRRRAPARPRAGQATQSSQAAPVVSAGAPVSESAATSGEAHQPESAPTAQQTAAAAPSTQATEQLAAKATRTHRGRGGRGRRSGGATIVVPSAPEAATDEAAAVAAEVAEAPNLAATPDTDLAGSAQPQVVSASEIRAEERAARTPPAFESPAAESVLQAVTAEPTWSPETLTTETHPTAEFTNTPVAAEPPATPPPSRYRFQRRGAVAAQQIAPTVRPERLSGRFATSLPGATGVPFEAAQQVPASEQQTPVATYEVEAITPEVRLTEQQTAGAPVVETTESAAALTNQVNQVNQASQANQAEAEEATETAETHEGAARRRRRRRRTPTSTPGAEEEGETERHEAAAPREGGNGFEATYAPSELETGYVPYAPYMPGASGATRTPAPYVPPTEPSWSITQGQQQLRQTASPFGAPEPSFAQGFGPQPRGVAQPFREPATRTTRTEREVSPLSASQLAQAVGGAIQQQTDRLITELRRQAVTPPAITVAMPPAQSVERVGVFVDVANLIYSARSMHMAIDFGRLLDFLRGNRRLIRAHAYAPTSPEPNAEQAFLSVVKGVGYRITTKNYKTFSSGAKKADLDLDMCMDIVRLVDGRAIDTVVLVSGDSDFLPVLEWASDKGVRIEVAAFEDAASAVLRQSCDLFVNLSLVPDLRA